MSDTVAFVATWATHWQVLEELHHRGRAAALRRLDDDRNHLGTADGPDGQYWHLEQAPGCVRHGHDVYGPHDETRLTAIVDHVAERMTAADGRQLDTLAHELHSAHARSQQHRWIDRGYPMPWEREASDAAHRASRALHALTRAVIARPLSEQLDLFAVPS